MRFQVRRENHVFRQNDTPLAEESHGADGVAEFAEISGPGVGEQLIHRFGMNRIDRFAFARGGGLELGRDQGRKLLHPLAQGRDEEGQAIEPMVEILAEFLLPNPLEERAVGCADDSCIGMEHLLGAEPLELAVFQHAQDFNLGERAHVRDLVEEKGSLIGQLEFPFHGLLGAGERTALVSEKLALDQGIAHRGGVESNEGPFRALRRIVNGVGEECFSGAGLAK